MRLLVVSTPVGPLGSGRGGGVELTLEGVTRGLASNGVDITVLAPPDGSVGRADGALDDATTDYRLIHIQRIHALTGPGGPGDLAWVWPLASLILLMVLLRRKR